MTGKKQATRTDVLKAIEECDPFAAEPDIGIEIVLPEAYPTGDWWRGRAHRAFLRRAGTERDILISATSTYALVEKIREGWKWDPSNRYHEGLLA